MTENGVTCHGCGRALREGDTAWASDWKVIDVSGESVVTRFVTRYSCDDCERVIPPGGSSNE